MARRSRDDDERSMDSLLDALTNVVGVLLLILIISSLGLSSAVKAIVENLPDVTKADLEKLKVRAEATRDNLKILKENAAEREKKPEEKPEQLILNLEKAKKKIKELVKNSDMEEIQKKIEEAEAQQKIKEIELTAAASDLAKIKAILSQTPEREMATPKVVKMPNPRPAAAESKAHYIICKAGKIYYVGDPYTHVLKVRDAIYGNFAKLSYTGGDLGSYTFPLQSTKQNPANRNVYLPVQQRVRRNGRFVKGLALENVKVTEIKADGAVLPERDMLSRLFGAEDRREFNVQRLRFDDKKVIAFFGKGKFGPKDFSYFIERNGTTDRLKLSLGFKEEGGWKVEQFKKRDSEFDKVCKQVALERNALFYFYVSADSFAAYLEARNITESYRIPAGWATWEGEKFIPRVMTRREKVTLRLDKIPLAQYENLAKTIGPKVIAAQKAEIASLDAKVAALVPKDMKDEAAKAKFITDLKKDRAAYFLSYVQPWTRQIYESVLAASEAKSTEEVRLDVHPPEIPHTRLFVKATFPNKPKPPPVPPDPNKPKPKPKPKPTTGTTLILD